jgi:hypothetical protein
VLLQDASLRSGDSHSPSTAAVQKRLDEYHARVAVEGELNAADVAALEAMAPNDTDPDAQAWIVRITSHRTGVCQTDWCPLFLCHSPRTFLNANICRTFRRPRVHIQAA